MSEVELTPEAAPEAMEQLRHLSRLDPEASKRPVAARFGSPVSGSDRAARVAKAEPVLVRADMTVAQGFQAIVAACIRHFRCNEPMVIEHRDVEGLHQVRVAMRRLRSALSLFGPAIEDAELERLRDELRWFTAELGDARNIDVFLQRGLHNGEHERLRKMRDSAYEAVIAAMESPRFRRLILDLVAWVREGAWRQNKKAAKPLARFAGRRIDRLWTKVAHARKLRSMSDRERHRLRIQVKKLRYALEFVAALHGSKKRKRFRKTTEEVQEALGQVHDLTIARTLLGPGPWPFLGQQKSEERGFLRDAGRSLRRLRKIGPYWRDRRA